MPKRTDLHKILIIGSGPIIISQACEFDYSGAQACKALKEEGYELVLVNSNPATIMTDPEMADQTYIEPLTVEFLEQIIEHERPDALLPTLGGQTGLNLSVALAERGVLARYGVHLVGATVEVIRRAEDRELFAQVMRSIDLDVPRSHYVHTVEEARAAADDIGYPCVIRPSFTLGGTGGGIAYNPEDLERLAHQGLELSMIHQISVEKSVVGWKEFELEVMRDRQDNVVIVCSIENVDPMGVHTGDSITVAPAQTLTDKEYQRMRDAAIRIIRAIGVETGGSNIQFAVHPETGQMLTIEMNPRVSRSSALASKATGFPIAKIAAKLAVGYTLDELPNDITQKTPACFEPTLDYCVVKIPRFAFEKFPGADPTLTTQMKSVGETMAIGRTFKEALQKGLRGLEVHRAGLESVNHQRLSLEQLREKLITPNAERIFYLGDALRLGVNVDELYELTKIDRWFLAQLRELIAVEQRLTEVSSLDAVTSTLMHQAKQAGFSDQQLATVWHTTEPAVRETRQRLGVVPQYALVDTCAAEFEAYTPYYYSTYERQPTSVGSTRPTTPDPRLTQTTSTPKVMILGGGPNRIGQGIEFDYCCVHAAFALKALGYKTIMVNSNPETVSTDYDTSDILYFEPVTLEDVLHIVDREQPHGVILQFGGQTPLNLAVGLERYGVPILGTTPVHIDEAEDRQKFSAMLTRLGLLQPPHGLATTAQDAVQIAHRIGYPCLVRPSYVLGGRAMEIVYDDEQLLTYMQQATQGSPRRPILVDKFLEDAIEVDVDLIGDGTQFVVGGILEHIEEAGVHSGDSAMVLPPYTLSDELLDDIRRVVHTLASELHIVGLMNAQLAIRDDRVYVLEVNPRASRTIPFVSKAIGVPLAKLAAQVLVGKRLDELGFTAEVQLKHVAVKESVFPFVRFAGVDILLGPEMRSTGEVMGLDEEFGSAFLKSQIAAGQQLPTQGHVFLSVKNKDKRAIALVAKRLHDLGFHIIATQGTAKALRQQGIAVAPILKIHEGRPNILDAIKSGQIQWIINTPSGRRPRADEIKIRSLATAYGIPCVTTLPGAQACVQGIETWLKRQLGVRSLQAYHHPTACSGVASPHDENH